MAFKVYIGVGSNLEPEKNIERAFYYLKEKVKITGISDFYETAPVGRQDQPHYINGVWEIETDIPPRQLKYTILRNIEEKVGRIRTEDKFISRVIDLDILIYGDKIIHEADFKIPDPDIYTREFVAVPLKELNPHLRIPGGDDRIDEISCRFDSHEMFFKKKITEKLRKGLKNEP